MNARPRSAGCTLTRSDTKFERGPAGQGGTVMATTIVGHFNQLTEARQAMEELLDSGFPAQEVHLISSESAATGAGGNPLDLLVNSGVPAPEAQKYDQELRRGGSLIALKAEDPT